VAASGVSLLLQHWTHSPRPFEYGGFPDLRDLDGLSGRSGFPSDYASFAFCAAGVVFFHERKLGWIAAAWSLFLCLVRISMGAHSGVQTAAGILLGLTFAVVSQVIPLPRWSWRLRSQAWAWAACFAIAFECSTLFSHFRWVIDALK
jgi:membrane-associated phospholipid phosphatase